MPLSSQRLGLYLLIITLLGCKGRDPGFDQNNENFGENRNQTYVTPTEVVPIDKWPVLFDDLDFNHMQLVIDRQLKRYQRLNLTGNIVLGGRTFPLKQVENSLKAFQLVIDNFASCTKNTQKYICYDLLNEEIRAKFLLFKPKLISSDAGYGRAKPARFTAYYTPLLEGSLVADQTFPHAIYNQPKTENLKTKSRVEIDFKGALKGLGLELFYVKDLFELYLLHVQGGGKVMVNTGAGVTSYYISYAGTNAQAWRFISNYMFQKGYIPDKSIRSQREFLQQNPQLAEEIYNYCPSYVYFKHSSTPPVGSDSVPLTDGRSIATDIQHYSFKGMLSYVEARRPRFAGDKSMTEFSRFFLDQDTGGAIKGKARVDLYHGEGAYAEFAAYNTDVRGNLYFLLLK